MNFQNIFIEESILKHTQAQKIMNSFSHLKAYPISKVEDYFGKVKKPYLHKRDSLNLFIGEKKGQLVKKAPPAYAGDKGEHFYFIHAYNCIYECEYCYLQGYFHSPDLVIFINHNEITQEMKNVVEKSQFSQNIWFHAGEFSDSLALSHLTGEIPHYFKIMAELPQAKLELRTKSNNIRELLKLNPLPNVITSFSLSPEKICKEYDHKTPKLSLRLNALSQLSHRGFPLAVHFDPIIDSPTVEEDYIQLISDLKKSLGESSLEYISLGVVRFPQDIFRQVKKNYPQSKILAAPLEVTPEDQIVRLPSNLRKILLEKIQQLILDSKIKVNHIYFSME